MSDEEEMLAAELVFGLIEGEEKKAAEARVAADPAFAATVARWQDHAVAMLAGREEAPRPSIWSAIEARLPASRAANDLGPAPARGSLRWWQAGTLLATAAALVLGVIATERSPLSVTPGGSLPVIQRPPQPQPTPPLVAVLTGTGKTAGAVLTVSYDPTTKRLTSAPTGMDVGRHAAELWVIPTGGKPRSLGVVADNAPSWTSAPDAAAPAVIEGATLAISVEPIDGSPTGKPTGPVILTGTIGRA